MYSRVALISFSAALLVSTGCTKKRPVAIRTSPPHPSSSTTANSSTSTATAPHKRTIHTTEPLAPPFTTEIGIASWYGYPFHGRAAANGEIYDMEKLTAAHRTLPFGTWVRVTNLTNNKTVDVRIIDRGPFIPGRILDLSHAAAQSIELIGPGIVQVRIDVISAPPLEIAGSLYSVQAGTFQDRNRAEQLRAAFEDKYGAARLVFKDGKPVTWRLLVGVEDTMDGASLLARKIQGEIGSGFVVRLDDLGATSATRSDRMSQ
jgi:rare lipoprotein A